MQAKDIMVAGANLATVRADDSIYTAIRLMLKKGISGVPVVEGGPLDTPKLVGVVTEGDFLRRRETKTIRRRPRWVEFLVGPGKLAEEYARASGCKVAEVMTAPAVAVNEEATIEEVVRLMERNRIKRVPVVRGDTLVGMITRADLLRALVRTSAQKDDNAQTDDAHLRACILREMEAQPWSPGDMVDVHVKNGVAKLTGVIMDDRARQAIVICAENIPGVRSVEDRIAFVEPLSGMVINSPDDEQRARAS